MKTIRRLYFYLVAFISLEVVLWGIISLLRSIINGSDVVNSTETLAQALALIFVGVPIFLFHWLWAQRTSEKDDEERSASLRAIFLYSTLLATLIPAVQNFLVLVNRIFLSTMHISVSRALVGSTQTLTDNVLAIFINLLIAAYFWNILRGEWRTLTDTENFTEIRRLQRFIWMLYGLLMTIYGAQLALNFVFTLPSQVLGIKGQATAINALALLGIGAPIWVYSWRILQDVLPNPAEKESSLRLGILYLLALGGVITTLTAGGNLIYVLLNHAFGEKSAWIDFMRKIGDPISIGLPFGVLWAYYGHWLNRQFAFDENEPRRAGKKRIYFYILSALGLTASFISVMSLLTFIVDMALDKTYLSSGGFRYSLSSALATLAVALPLWLMTWRTMQADALAEGDMGDHARRSIIRRVYLYLALFAGVIGGMVSAVMLVFRLINALLGGDTTALAEQLINPFNSLVLFVVLLLYHLSTLRKDGVSHTKTLEEKQEKFHVLVLDKGDGKFGELIKAAFAKRALKVTFETVNVNEAGAELKANAMILPASIALNPPKNAEAWIRSFGGNRLIVNDEAAGFLWMNDLGQAVASVQALAEGQDIRPQSPKRGTSVWTYVAYVFAALFALQLIFILVSLGIALVTGNF
jgi:hypothetical protein